MQPQVNPNDPIQLLGYAMANFPGTVAFIPMFTPAHPERTLIVKTQIKDKAVPPHMQQMWAQQNGGSDPGPAPTHIETARMVCIMPSDVIRNARGPVDDRDVIMLMLVKRSTYERAVGGLVTPIGSRLVMP